MPLLCGSAGRRLAAFAWDYFLIAVYVVGLSLVSSFVWLHGGGEFPAITESTRWRFDLLAFVTLVLPVTLYFALAEASSMQATWGKRRLGLRVVGTDGTPLSRGRSLVRSGLKFLPWQISHTCLFHVPGWPVAPAAPPPWVIVGFVVAFVLAVAYVVGLVAWPGGRTAYDWIAGSRVVLR